MLRLAKIISGGQSGADLGGLWGGKALGIATGGAMPKGFRTEAGPRHNYAALFGMRATSSSSYRSRTRQNVIESDGTVIFVGRSLAGGSLLTKRLCEDFGKPCFVLAFPATDDQHKLFAYSVRTGWRLRTGACCYLSQRQYKRSRGSIDSAIIHGHEGRINMDLQAGRGHFDIRSAHKDAMPRHSP
jgi:Circularly permutated YpsA SLOG family